MLPRLIAPGCQPCSGSSCALWAPAQCTLLLLLAVTCGPMWGFSSSEQQKEEGDLLCSQLFRPVLTVLWSCVGETVWLPPSLPPSSVCSIPLLPLQLAKHMHSKLTTQLLDTGWAFFFSLSDFSLDCFLSRSDVFVRVKMDWRRCILCVGEHMLSFSAMYTHAHGKL